MLPGTCENAGRDPDHSTRAAADSSSDSSNDTYAFKRQRRADTGDESPRDPSMPVPNVSSVPPAETPSDYVCTIFLREPEPLAIGFEDNTVELDDWLRSPGSRDGFEGDVTEHTADLGTVLPMSELFDRYVIPEVTLDEHSYRRSSINTESIYGFHDLQSIVETGATIFDQQSLKELRSVGLESHEVLAAPPEVTESYPPDDRNPLILSDTVVSAIAKQLSVRLPQLSGPAVVMRENQSTNTLTPVLVNQGSGPSCIRPQFFLPRNVNLTRHISVITSHVGEPISTICKHVAGATLDTLGDQEREILHTLSTLVATAFVTTGTTLLRRLQSI